MGPLSSESDAGNPQSGRFLYFCSAAVTSHPRPWAAWKHNLNSCQAVCAPKARILRVLSFLIPGLEMGCEGFLAHEWRGAAEIFALPSCMCFCLPYAGLGSAGLAANLEAQNHICLHHNLLLWEVLGPEEPVSTAGGGVNPELIRRQLSVTPYSPSPSPVFRQLPGGEEVRKPWGLAGLARPWQLPLDLGSDPAIPGGGQKKLCGTSQPTQKVRGCGSWPKVGKADAQGRVAPGNEMTQEMSGHMCVCVSVCLSLSLSLPLPLNFCFSPPLPAPVCLSLSPSCPSPALPIPAPHSLAPLPLSVSASQLTIAASSFILRTHPPPHLTTGCWS